MRVKAESKWLRIGPRKLGRVLATIRGRGVKEALIYLKFLPQKGARIIEKTIRSAVANAVNNYKLAKEGLTLAEVFVNEAPMYKRWQPRAKGRAYPIKKRNSHLTVWVAPAKEVD